VLLIALRASLKPGAALPRWPRPPALSARACIVPCRRKGILGFSTLVAVTKGRGLRLTVEPAP